MPGQRIPSKIPYQSAEHVETGAEKILKAFEVPKYLCVRIMKWHHSAKLFTRQYLVTFIVATLYLFFLLKHEASILVCLRRDEAV